MTTETVQQNFREKVSTKIWIEPDGNERFRVFTPFMFEDGDHLSIVLKKEGIRWVLSDEAHTYMHLTYDIEERDLRSGTRQSIISNVLSIFEIDDRDGELIIEVLDDRYGDALYSFIQALIKISDVSYLSQERAQSTFMEDFRVLLSETAPESRRAFDWFDLVHDPGGKYRVDCRINGMQSPLFVYALTGDLKTRDATISLLQFEKWHVQHRPVAIFEDKQSISRGVLARFTDVCQTQFSNLESVRDDIFHSLKEL
jgi:hypothetical protein